MSGSNAIYFATTDTSGFYPNALWVTDGTSGGTRLIATYPAGVTVQPLGSDAGGFVFGVGSAGATNLYFTLGTAASTHFVLNAPFGPLPADTASNHIAFLTATTLVGGFTYANNTVTVGYADLINGAPTPLLINLTQNPAGVETATGFTSLGGVAFFVDANSLGVANLYRTDGTTPGTIKLTSAAGFANLTSETNAAAVTRIFLSKATTSTPSTSDGVLLSIGAADATPSIIFDFGVGTAVDSITNAAGLLFMVVRNANGTRSIWTDDGSAAPPVLIGTVGTAAVSQIQVAGDGSARVYFQAGSTVETAVATGITSLGAFSRVGTLFASAGKLYFGADDGVNGLQLWASTGTLASTTQIAVINPSGDANPTNFAVLGAQLLFSANDGAHGAELFSWNGSAATVVANLAPGAIGSNPYGLTAGAALTTGAAGPGVVTYQTANFLNNYGYSDGTFAGTSAGQLPNPTVFSISGGNGFLTISHGSADTTLSVPVDISQFSFLNTNTPLSFTSTGAFFTYSGGSKTDGSAPSLIGFIGDTSLTPVTLLTVKPTVTNGTTNILDQVAVGPIEYFLVEKGDGNYLNRTSQLWTSDGSAANTKLVASLGAVYDPNTASSFTNINNAVADSQAWGTLLKASSGGAISLFTSTGATGNFASVSLASIGLSAATFNNTGQNSLGLLGATYLFSIKNGTSIAAVATDGTGAGTKILTTETPASSSQTYGDFVRAGNLVYFDDGVGGALYVSDGTAANTRQLLTTGAYIAPYSAAFNSIVTPSTASITVGVTTYFYFVAVAGGQTGLYYSDGTTVHTVKAAGLAKNSYVTASGNAIFFAADGGTGFTTLWITTPGAPSAAPVVDPNLFPASSLLATVFGAPQGVTNIQAGSPYPVAPDTFFLLSGTDTVAGGAGDTAIYASPGGLSAGDQIDGGAGINDLYLSGTGAFDLSAPASLNNITQALVTAAHSTITLRDGTAIRVNLAGSTGGLADTITGANNSDIIKGSGNDTITVGSTNETIFNVGRAIVTAATAGGTISATVLEIANGGTVVLGTSISNIGTVTLDAATNLTVNFPPSFNSLISGSAGADTITLNNALGINNPAYFLVKGNGGGDLFILNNGGAVSADFIDLAANLNASTIQGFNFTPVGAAFQNGPADFIDITDFAYSASEITQFASGTLTVTDATGSRHTSIAIPGAPAGGGFLLSGDSGSGTLVRYVQQVVTLTAGNDTVAATTTNQINVPAGALTAGDHIDGGDTGQSGTLQSTMQLIGAGSFDLSAPASLTQITSVLGDTTGSNIGGSTAIAQTITLRAGLNTKVVLGAGHDTLFGAANSATITSLPENLFGGGDVIYLGGPREVVQLSGVAADVIHVTAATSLARVIDTLEGSGTPIGTEAIDGGGIVGLGDVTIGQVLLTAPTKFYALATAPDKTVGGAGHDLIDLTNAGAGSFGGLISVAPKGGGDQIFAPINDGLLVTGTQAELNNTTISGFNFLPAASSGQFGLMTPVTIDITDLAKAGVTTSFSGGTLTVLNNGVAVDTFLLPGAPGAGGFTVTADTAGSGSLLGFVPSGSSAPVTATLSAGQTSFAASPGDDTLNVPAGALTNTQTLDGMGGVNTLSLTSAGTYDLTLPASLANFQLLRVAAGATVIMRAGGPVDVAATNATIIAAAAQDTIAVIGNGNTVVVGNAGATILDGGLNTTYSASAATAGATFTGPRDGSGSLLVTGNGGVVMGTGVSGVSSVNLTPTGAVFYANATPGLRISVSGTVAGPRDIVIAGAGGDVVTDTSVGGNILAAGAGNDAFIFGSINQNGPPAGDTLYNFDVSGTDMIGIPFLLPNSPSFNNGTLTVGAAGDPRQLNLVLRGTYTGQFSAGFATSFTGTVVTFVGTVQAATVPCFAEGTRIATRRGMVLVEALCEGDEILTAIDDGAAPMRWLGRRRVDCGAHPRPEAVWPVRIAADAFGPGLPERALFLSPDHAIYVDDVLIPVKYLINGRSIVQVAVKSVTYYHVALAEHDVLFAEGLPAESYLDTDGPHQFDNGGVVLTLHPDFALSRPDDTGWETSARAELVVTGPRLASVRKRLADQIVAFNSRSIAATKSGLARRI